VGVVKIVSGGQTGIDRGALDAALAANFPCGGWCPGDRMAEDGVIPDRYPLMALPNGGYRARTRQENNGIQTLNVAGPRASRWAEGYGLAVA
jgi:hypothetical protein